MLPKNARFIWLMNFPIDTIAFFHGLKLYSKIWNGLYALLMTEESAFFLILRLEIKKRNALLTLKNVFIIRTVGYSSSTSFEFWYCNGGMPICCFTNFPKKDGLAKLK